jgi:hypothetical protein
MTAYIPIYAEYYDDKNNVITKEISYKGGEIGIYITVEDYNSSIKIRYVNSKIKMAASMAKEWADENKIIVNFASYIFTTDAKPEWWTFQPRDATFINNQYEAERLSLYKRKGYGIIIRAGNLPWINNTHEGKKFTCELIPF